MPKRSLSTRDAAESIAAIRSVLDRTTRYTHISWVGIVIAGASAAVTGTAGWVGEVSPTARPSSFLALWSAALLVAFAFASWTTARKARAAREPFWSRKLQVVALGFLPSVVLAAIATALLLDVGQLDLAPGLWMGLYAVGILSVCHVLDWEFQLTGWAFLLSSSMSFFLLRASPNAAMTLGFGGIHLVLGGFRFFKERRWE
jgi:hypothetical protein